MKTAKLRNSYWILEPPVVYVDSKGDLKGCTKVVYLGYNPLRVEAYDYDTDGSVGPCIGRAPGLLPQWHDYVGEGTEVRLRAWKEIESEFFHELGYEVTLDI